MLIHTKLQVPPLSSRLLDRKRLIDQIWLGKDRRLILITGQAGSGKTSLVYQWINTYHSSTAYYSLDKTDNAPDIFFRYLLTALGNIDHGLEVAIGPLLQKQKILTGEEIVPHLIQALGSLHKEINLVLDDYHLITSNDIHDALSFFLQYMPKRMHFFILSRRCLPSTMARFKIRNQMVEITASDLRFTDKETELFFKEIMPTRLSTEQLGTISKGCGSFAARQN